MRSAYQILLFYKYAPLKNPEVVFSLHKKWCEELGLKGRVIISNEGINETVEGSIKNTEEYIKRIRSEKEFGDIHFKKSPGTGDAFPKLSIKLRKEIVSTHLNESDIKPWTITGKYITAEELHEWFRDKKKEFYIVDMRNDYEQKSGYFKGSILSEFGHFRDLPKILEKIEDLKDKTIVTVCTGGVRCEKASGFLVGNGFSDVYQLSGGIVTYMEKYPNEDYLGKLYVFDGRILMGFNTDDPHHEIVGKCELCNTKSENYVNCSNSHCNHHFICCENCTIANDPFCENCRYLLFSQKLSQ